MVGEDRLARLHQSMQHVAARPLRQVVGDRLVGDVVRRLRLRARRGATSADLPRQTRMLRYCTPAWNSSTPPADFLPAEFVLKGLDELRPSSLEMCPAVKSSHVAVGDVDEVAADGPVVGAEVNAHRGGFERARPV